MSHLNTARGTYLNKFVFVVFMAKKEYLHIEPDIKRRIKGNAGYKGLNISEYLREVIPE